MTYKINEDGSDVLEPTDGIEFLNDDVVDGTELMLGLLLWFGHQLIGGCAAGETGLKVGLFCPVVGMCTLFLNRYILRKILNIFFAAKYFNNKIIIQ